MMVGACILERTKILLWWKTSPSYVSQRDSETAGQRRCEPGLWSSYDVEFGFASGSSSSSSLTLAVSDLRRVGTRWNEIMMMIIGKRGMEAVGYEKKSMKARKKARQARD